MALPQVTSSTSTLKGAREFNYTHMVTAYQDVGGKIAALVSTVNAIVSSVSALNVAVSALNAAAVSAANSAATWSAFSATPTSSILLASYAGTLSNFSS